MASCAALVDVLEHDDPGLHGDAEQGQESNPRRHAEVGVGEQQRQQTTHAGEQHVQQNQHPPFERTEHGVKNDEDHQDGQRHHDQQPRLRALLALVLAGPLDTITGRQLDLLTNLLHSVPNRAAQVPASHVEGHGVVSGVPFAVDVVGAVFHLHRGQLGQGDPFTGRREKTDIGDGLFGVAIRRLVSHDNVVSLLAEEHLTDRVAAHGGLNGVLDVGHVNSKTGRLPAVDSEVEIRLAESVKEFEVLQARHGRHGGDDFLALLVKSLEVLPEKLERQLSFRPGDRFADIVLDGLREIPQGPRQLADFAIHRRDQFLLVPMEHRPPLVLLFQVYEILGIAESSGVGSIVGPPHLGHDFRHLRKGREDQAGLVGEARALGETGAVGQCSASPDCTLVQVRQEFRADHSAECQIGRRTEGRDAHAERDPAVPDRPTQIRLINAGQEGHDRVAPFSNSLAKEDAR